MTLKTEFHDEIEAIKAVNKAFEDSQTKVSALRDKALQVATENLKTFPLGKCYFGGFSAGSATSAWIPKIRIDPTADHPTRNELSFVCVEDNEENLQFVWYEGHGYEVYPHKINKEGLEPAYNTDEFLAACKKISEELGIPVGIETRKLRSFDLGMDVETKDDLLLAHPGGRVLAYGDIVYMGWDCFDSWGIVEDASGKHLYYGTSGHGGGMNNHIPPGGDLTPFFDLHKDNQIQVQDIDLAKEIFGIVGE